MAQDPSLSLAWFFSPPFTLIHPGVVEGIPVFGGAGMAVGETVAAAVDAGRSLP